jgi:glycosyltransferase A (GT-A) superfamily protein (DUF2064 family)
LIIVFAKAPVRGKVKTRLGLPPQVAAALHEAFIRDTLRSLERWSGRVRLHLTEPHPAFPDVAHFQNGRDLGERMLYALANAPPPVSLIGSDSPSLPPGHLLALEAVDADVAFGPAEDGGFWGIHCRRTEPRMFHGVEWSAPHTLAQTLAACSQAGLTTALGLPWFDVDDRASLERLALDPPPHTRAVLDTLPQELRGV